MTENNEIGTLRDYLGVLRRRRMTIIVSTVVAVLAALAYGALKDPVYEATATVSIEDPQAQAGTLLGQPEATDFFPKDEAAAGAEVVTGNKVADAVRSKLRIGESRESVQSKISTEVQLDSNLVAIMASDGEAQTAADLANGFALQTKAVLKAQARRFFTQSAKSLAADPTAVGVDAYTARLRTLAAVADPVEIVRPAEVPTTPASPRPLRDSIIAAILGFAIGVGIAFLRHSLDRRLTDTHEVQRRLGIPLVGYVRADALGAAPSSNGTAAVEEGELEAYRILRANTDFLAKDHDLRSVAITSALPEEGKSTVATWYAYANAVAGRRTLLIECDFRRPVLALRLEVDPAPGLSDYLLGEATPKQVLRSVAVEGFEAVDALPLIPAGTLALQPTEMLASKRFQSFLSQVSRAYDLVVLDTAPLLPVGDTRELLPYVDGVLFCVRIGQTTTENAEAAREALERLPGKPTGLVITGIPSGGDDDYYGYYSSSGRGREPGVRT